MSKNVFIDLGSFSGYTIRKFIESPLYRPDFEIHGFEANPLFNDSFFKNYPKGVIIHREAAWTENGTVEIFVNKDHRPSVQGTSVYKEKITGDLDREHPISVPCIDFSAWITKNFSIDDNIIVKSNIEGAEYPVFSKMIADGSIRYIKQLYLRRHWHKIGMPEQFDKQFMEKLLAIPSLTVKGDYDFK